MRTVAAVDEKALSQLIPLAILGVCLAGPGSAAAGFWGAPNEQIGVAKILQKISEQAPTPAGETPKTFNMEMRAKPWAAVLEWFSDQTGLPILATEKPAGTFSFVARNQKRYTLAEIVDILNEGLAPQNLLLIRGDRSVVLVRADERIDPALVPRVRPEDLAQRGKTEVVWLVVPLKSPPAEEVAPEIKKIMGPHGQVIVLGNAKQLLLQDSAGNLQLIVQTIQAIETKEPAAPAAKPLTFEVRQKSWEAVLEWLTEQTGLPVVGNSRPAGSFTFISPKGKTYTLPEIIDLLNDALESRQFILLRRERSYLLVPSDEKIDPAIVPRVPVGQLAQRGATELVSVVVPLTTAQANEIAPDIKKLMGRFGEVVVVSRANQLILQDTAGNLRRIMQTINDIEKASRQRPSKPAEPK
jgi:type II secretory pathway component GspD/PulD (secretin)